VQGLLSQRVLKVVYRPFDSAVQTGKSSRICPYHMANLQGEWYLFGVHEGHDDVRQFALARIEQAEVTRKPYSIPEDFQAGELLDTAFGRYVGNGQARNVRLVFQKEIAEWITTRQWHPLQNLKRRGNGDIELSFSTEGMFEVQRWVLSWGRWVKVLEPRELVESVAAEVTVMASYHAHTQGVKHGKERSR
jgi:predicted DNA-binding transcriptional regulator YafY